MISGENLHPGMEYGNTHTLSNTERRAITLRAELRREEQGLKFSLLNIRQPWANETMKATEEKYRKQVAEALSGETLVLTDDEQHEGAIVRAVELQDMAIETRELFPVLAAYQLGRAAQLRYSAGCDVTLDMEALQTVLQDSKKSANASADLLPDALLIGLRKKIAESLDIPAMEKVAKSVLTDKKLLRDYALVLTEAERSEFLALVPDDARREIGTGLDEAVSTTLNQGLVEKGTDEEKQRKEVRMRAYVEMRSVMADSKTTDKKIAAALARTFGNLGGDARLLLLELLRDEMGKKSNGESADEREQDQEKQNYIPHVIYILLKHFDDFRVNDLALQLAGDRNTPERVARHCVLELVKRGYLPSDVGEWWKDKKSDRTHSLELLQCAIADLRIIPNRAILEFLADDAKWQGISLPERVAKIRESQTEFAAVKTQTELIEILAEDEKKAMMYYLLHGGDDRFNLINNYSFDKFLEMIKLIADLRVHEVPIRTFVNALKKGGLSPAEIQGITDRLRAGHFPLPDSEQASQEVSFEVSENAAVKNANTEIGRVLGREQLGVVLLFPMYREYLEAETESNVTELITRMQNAHTFAERLVIILEIDAQFPNFQTRAKKDLQDNWQALGEKMVLEVTLDDVCNNQALAVRGEELIPRINNRRLDLKRMKKELLVAVKGGNERLKTLRNTLSKKKRARSQLAIGLERQQDLERRNEIETNIKKLDMEINDLELQRAVFADMKVDERFNHLSKEDKKAEIKKIGREMIALTEKSPSAIFTYLTAQVLGEDRLREQDVQLIAEMESHLQGPFQTIADRLTYQSTARDRDIKKNQRVSLQYVDKVDRFMNMVRFADSKICCFSSNNYEMVVQHDMPNKFWVASINADPMSFVLSIETPSEAGGLAEPADDMDGSRPTARENLGFIFGSFAVDEAGKLAVMLNGIYYAPGIEDDKQVSAFLDKVHAMFAGLPIHTTAIATQHGGAVKMPDGFSNDGIKLTRLRALDDGSGNPETKIYDDLGTGSGLNQSHSYSDSVWHKKSNPNS